MHEILRNSDVLKKETAAKALGPTDNGNKVGTNTPGKHNSI